MARYHEVPTYMKITSEMIEPTFGSIIARLWMQAEYMKDTQGIDSWAYADALENLWYALDRLSSLASLCIDTVHAVIAMSNHQMEIASIIEKEIGFNPIRDKECVPFRHYINVTKEAVRADEMRREMLKNTPPTPEQLKLISDSVKFMNSFRQ